MKAATTGRTSSSSTAPCWATSDSWPTCQPSSWRSKARPPISRNGPSSSSTPSAGPAASDRSWRRRTSQFWRTGLPTSFVASSTTKIRVDSTTTLDKFSCWNLSSLSRRGSSSRRWSLPTGATDRISFVFRLVFQAFQTVTESSLKPRRTTRTLVGWLGSSKQSKCHFFVDSSMSFLSLIKTPLQMKVGFINLYWSLHRCHLDEFLMDAKFVGLLRIYIRRRQWCVL